MITCSPIDQDSNESNDQHLPLEYNKYQSDYHNNETKDTQNVLNVNQIDDIEDIDDQIDDSVDDDNDNDNDDDLDDNVHLDKNRRVIENGNKDSVLFNDHKKPGDSLASFPKSVRCLPGFQTDPTNRNRCIDIDECQLQLNKCTEDQECINEHGSYHCKDNPKPKGLCPLGFHYNTQTQSCQSK